MRGRLHRLKVWCRRLWWKITGKASPTGFVPGDTIKIHFGDNTVECYVVSQVKDKTTVQFEDGEELTL